MASSDLFIGVDVGSGSVRSGLFNAAGNLIEVSIKPITINHPEPDYYEQSAGEIWEGIAWTVKNIIKDVKNVEDVKGIAFDATCSMAAFGDTPKDPVSLSKSGDPNWNIIMWMDHRASEEADLINSTGHRVLNYVGGKISLEMETPKVLWLKKNLPDAFNNTKQFFDLCDWLRWQTLGGANAHRSVCGTVCKWTYVNEPGIEGGGWDPTYFSALGMNSGEVIGKLSSPDGKMSCPGDFATISPTVAKEFGLSGNVQVGYSMIDAYAGILGMLDCHADGEVEIDVSARLGIICGTSTCHMALNKAQLMIPGVWGPFHGVIFSDYYLSEGGQSAAGALLDYIVKSHVSYVDLLNECNGNHGDVLVKLESILKYSMSIEDVETFCNLSRDLHIWPDFHGNRSPLADPTLKGMWSGLVMSASRENLALLYLATLQALAYGTRHIKQVMETHGHSFKELVICGGLAKSKLFLQLNADILGLTVIVPACKEPVLLGAAISAAAAYENSKGTGAADPNETLKSVGKRMGGHAAVVIHPNQQLIGFHNKKYKVFLRMLSDQREYKKMME